MVGSSLSATIRLTLIVFAMFKESFRILYDVREHGAEENVRMQVDGSNWKKLHTEEFHDMHSYQVL